MPKYFILWRSPETLQWDLEEYDSRDEAQADLDSFQQKYPWNTYFLCDVTDKRVATEKWKPPYTVTVLGGKLSFDDVS